VSESFSSLMKVEESKGKYTLRFSKDGICNVIHVEEKNFYFK